MSNHTNFKNSTYALRPLSIDDSELHLRPNLHSSGRTRHVYCHSTSPRYVIDIAGLHVLSTVHGHCSGGDLLRGFLGLHLCSLTSIKATCCRPSHSHSDKNHELFQIHSNITSLAFDSCGTCLHQRRCTPLSESVYYFSVQRVFE
jgi:hypothetical protein